MGRVAMAKMAVAAGLMDLVGKMALVTAEAMVGRIGLREASPAVLEMVVAMGRVAMRGGGLERATEWVPARRALAGMEVDKLAVRKSVMGAALGMATEVVAMDGAVLQTRAQSGTR